MLFLVRRSGEREYQRTEAVVESDLEVGEYSEQRHEAAQALASSRSPDRLDREFSTRSDYSGGGNQAARAERRGSRMGAGVQLKLAEAGWWAVVLARPMCGSDTGPGGRLLRGAVRVVRSPGWASPGRGL